MGKFEEYRKAIAALAVGLIAMVGQFVPAVRDVIGPETVNLVSVLGAAAAAFLFANSKDGWNVAEAAEFLLEELAKTESERDAEAGDVGLAAPRAGGSE